MRKIRLDNGVLSAPAKEGDSYVFFLYKESMDRCLPIELTPPQMHSILVNLKPTLEADAPLHSVFTSTLIKYGIEVLEMDIIKEEENKNFQARLLLSNGEKERYQDISVIDGVIIAKILSAPIYIEESLMDEYSVQVVNEKVMDPKATLRNLKEELERAITDEEYERAATIKAEIQRLNNRK